MYNVISFDVGWKMVGYEVKNDMKFGWLPDTYLVPKGSEEDPVFDDIKSYILGMCLCIVHSVNMVSSRGRGGGNSLPRVPPPVQCSIVQNGLRVH